MTSTISTETGHALVLLCSTINITYGIMQDSCEKLQFETVHQLMLTLFTSFFFACPHLNATMADRGEEAFLGAWHFYEGTVSYLRTILSGKLILVH